MKNEVFERLHEVAYKRANAFAIDACERVFALYEVEQARPDLDLPYDKRGPNGGVLPKVVILDYLISQIKSEVFKIEFLYEKFKYYVITKGNFQSEKEELADEIYYFTRNSYVMGDLFDTLDALIFDAPGKGIKPPKGFTFLLPIGGSSAEVIEKKFRKELGLK